MRVLIDTNVFISYLLSSRSSGTIHSIFEAWSWGAFTLLAPEELLQEVLVTVTRKPSLRENVPSLVLEEFLTLVRDRSELIPQITTPIPAVTRDLKDDYLLAYALFGRADCLVTGDEDSLVLDGLLPELRILSPHDFLELVLQ